MRKIYKNIMSLLLTIMITITSTVAISAESDHTFGLSLIDYDVVENGYSGVGTTPLQNGSVVQEDQVFQLDVNYTQKGAVGFLGAKLVVQFDTDLVEPVYIDGIVDPL